MNAISPREGRRAARWAPPFLQALRLALRPALAYLLFTIFGSVALFGSVAAYEGGGDLLELVLGLIAGVIGVVAGQLLAISRVRVLPVLIALGAFGTAVITFVTFSSAPFPKEVGIPLLFFAFAFPCGMLSLQHRWELLASFWPSIGWIGGVFVILNNEGRVHDWERDKVQAWLPVPLFLLFGFLVFWLLYLSAKQAVRVELWQALSGAVMRRVAKKTTISALPRKNVLSLLIVAVALFAITAVLAPYLWRTGKGDHESKHPHDQTSEPQTREGPKLDGDSIIQQMQKLARAAKETAAHLWPLLLLLLLYRPAKRALLHTHLLRPLVPTPPTERIDNGWEYVRIAAEDAGVVPSASDSVEELLARVEAKSLMTPAVLSAAEIYARTRYGFTVARGDAEAMRGHAATAGRELRAHLTPWQRIRNLWRPLV